MVFVVNDFFQIPSSSFREKRKKVENQENDVNGLQKNESERKHRLFLITKVSEKTVYSSVMSHRPLILIRFILLNKLYIRFI